MNLVSLLIAPAVVAWSVGDDRNVGLRVGIAVVATLIVVAAVVFSKRKGIAMGDSDDSGTGAGSADQRPETVNA